MPLQMQLLASHLGALILGGLMTAGFTSVNPALLGRSAEIGLVILLVVVVLSLSSGQIVVEPIRAMRHSIGAFVAGDFDARVPLSDVPELRRLAIDLNRLATSVQNFEEARRQRWKELLHETRTPLTILHSDLTLACQGKLPSSSKLLEKHLRQVKRLNYIVAEVTSPDWERPRSYIPVTCQALSLPNILYEVVELIAALPETQGHKVLVRCPSSLPPIWADSHQVYQILENLLRNAILYTPQGRVLVEVWVEHRFVWTAIIDEGIGIAASELQTIFERGHRSEAARMQNPYGQGLGLEIVKRLVELQGGVIQVESEPGQGSKFTFSLPMA